MSIKTWHEDDRPREKMLSMGASALSRSELLAILINNGSREKSAIDLAREVLELSSNSLHTLARLGIADLMKVRGIGEAKAIAIKAAMELSIRKQEEAFKGKPVLRSAADIVPFLKSLLADMPVEYFVIVLLNRSCRYIGHHEISRGGISGTVVDPKIVLKRAIEAEASMMILVHNHPSGSLKPSVADRELTKKIQAACKLLDIQVVDHLIVSQEGYYSFSDSGEI